MYNNHYTRNNEKHFRKRQVLRQVIQQNSFLFQKPAACFLSYHVINYTNIRDGSPDGL
jgi:hypothetical protein